MSMTEYTILAESQRFEVAIDEATEGFHTSQKLEQSSKHSQPYSIPQQFLETLKKQNPFLLPLDQFHTLVERERSFNVSKAF